jgi:hypothetical protein
MQFSATVGNDATEASQVLRRRALLDSTSEQTKYRTLGAASAPRGRIIN